MPLANRYVLRSYAVVRSGGLAVERSYCLITIPDNNQ